MSLRKEGEEPHSIKILNSLSKMQELNLKGLNQTALWQLWNWFQATSCQQPTALRCLYSSCTEATSDMSVCVCLAPFFDSFLACVNLTSSWEQQSSWVIPSCGTTKGGGRQGPGSPPLCGDLLIYQSALARLVLDSLPSAFAAKSITWGVILQRLLKSGENRPLKHISNSESFNCLLSTPSISGSNQINTVAACIRAAGSHQLGWQIMAANSLEVLKNGREHPDCL